MTLYFYTADSKCGFLSSFSLHAFTLDGHHWKTVEHYFQAQKFYGTPHAESIRHAKTPKQAFILGNSRKYKIRNDWEEIKDKIMFKATLKKFQTHPDIRQLLLETKDEEIVENSDSYWGGGGDGNGENKLGKILMEIRNLLKEPH